MSDTLQGQESEVMALHFFTVCKSRLGLHQIVNCMLVVVQLMVLMKESVHVWL